MTEQKLINATAFGQVLVGLMESRGISPEPEQFHALAERSGLDTSALLTRMTVGWIDVGALGGLAEELGLSEPEKLKLAYAHAYDELDTDDS
jgi:hypothetical protein